MESLDMESLEAMLAKARELQAVLRETPEILAFLRLAKDTNGESRVVPKRAGANRHKNAMSANGTGLPVRQQGGRRP